MQSRPVPAPSPPTFSTDRTARLREMENSHFWFVGRRRLVERLMSRHVRVGSTILDVGCGTASLAERVAAGRHRVLGLDLNSEGLKSSRPSSPQLLRVQGDAAHLPVRPGSFDAALALDVLEHVDDRSVLAEIRDALVPNGIVLLTVPALPWLWSHRDDAAGHLRRYRRRALLHQLAESGFEIVESSFYQFLLLPLLAATRLAGRSGPTVRDLEDRPGRTANLLLTRISLIDVHLGSVISWPIGSSLAVVCRKSP